jgi:urea carboxylase
MPVAAAAAVARWTAEALQKYMKSARAEAPYLPSNIQYIANNNGLEDREDVSASRPGCLSSVRGIADVCPAVACVLAGSTA